MISSMQWWVCNYPLPFCLRWLLPPLRKSWANLLMECQWIDSNWLMRIIKKIKHGLFFFLRFNKVVLSILSVIIVGINLFFVGSTVTSSLPNTWWVFTIFGILGFLYLMFVGYLSLHLIVALGGDLSRFGVSLSILWLVGTCRHFVLSFASYPAFVCFWCVRFLFWNALFVMFFKWWRRMEASIEDTGDEHPFISLENDESLFSEQNWTRGSAHYTSLTRVICFYVT